MIRTTLVVCLFLIALASTRAQAPDSVAVASILTGGITLHYSEAALKCAIAGDLGSGATISTANVVPTPSGWALQASGTIAGSGVTIAYTLSQHGVELYLVATNFWQSCTGVQCSGCTLLYDDQGRGYCDCFKKAVSGGYCNHAEGDLHRSVVSNLLFSCGT